MCILPLGENGLEKYRLSKKWEQFKIVLLFMDHPVWTFQQPETESNWKYYAQHAQKLSQELVVINSSELAN